MFKIDQSLWKMTKRVMRVPTPSPPGHPRGNRSLRLREGWSPCRQSGGSVSAGDRSFGPGRYWEGWRGAEVLPHYPCQRTQVNQPWGGSGSHLGSQVRQGSGPERYSEQGPEASPTASGILLVLIFNAILVTHRFPTVWKHARVISILKPGKDSALPSSIGPSVFWTRLVNYSKRSYYLGSYTK